MQHFRAEGGHLSRFFEGNNVNTFGGRHHAWIGGVNAWDIGPDIHARRIQRFTQQGCRVVASATAKRRGAAFGFAPDKALSNDDPFCKARGQLLF
ncbi:hypothetical protein D3C80_1219710 [compost metagenome]